MVDIEGRRGKVAGGRGGRAVLLRQVQLDRGDAADEARDDAYKAVRTSFLKD